MIWQLILLMGFAGAVIALGLLVDVVRVWRRTGSAGEA